MHKTGRISCDCINHVDRSLCSHVLAVGEVTGKLEDLLSWYKRTNQSANLWTLARSSRVPKYSGARGGKPPASKQRGKLNCPFNCTPVHTPLHKGKHFLQLLQIPCLSHRHIIIFHPQCNKLIQSTISDCISDRMPCVRAFPPEASRYSTHFGYAGSAGSPQPSPYSMYPYAHLVKPFPFHGTPTGPGTSLRSYTDTCGFNPPMCMPIQ